MRTLIAVLALFACMALIPGIQAEEKSAGKIGGPFDVKAITGDKAGKETLLRLPVQCPGPPRRGADLHPEGRREPGQTGPGR